MLKTAGRATLLVRLGRWMCTCIPRHALDSELSERIKPVRVGWLACWCDRGSSA